MANKDTKSLKDLDLISDALREASSYSLTAEVFLWSLYHMKENPNASIEEALNAGMREWDL